MKESRNSRIYMYHLYSAIAIILFPSLTSFAQIRYEDYSPSDIILFDNFSNNKNGWPIGYSQDSCYGSKMENGTFEITSFCKGTNPLYWITQPIDTKKDFEIESELAYVQGEDDNSINLMWGKDKNDYRYRFGISGNGKYRIDAYNGNWFNLKEWTASDTVHKTEYNKLTARKIGSSYFFFLNENLVHNCKFYNFYGSQVGFQDNQNTTMRINYLKISYLKPSSDINLSSIKQKDENEPINLTGFGGSFGLGYIHSSGEIRDLWKDGFDIDLMFWYLFVPRFGFEFGFNYGITGIAEDKKITVSVVDNYGNGSTRTTAGGQCCSFPIGLKYTCPLIPSSDLYLSISGGGNYYFEDEWGMDDVTDYTSRGTSGFGYYARISISSLEDIDIGENFGWGLQIKYISSNAKVGDFYKYPVSKSIASDGRLILVLEVSWL